MFLNLGMKSFLKLVLAGWLLIISMRAIAQEDTTSAAGLIKQGIQLNGQEKYPEAIEKYTGALKIDSSNAQANYQMGFTLFAAGRGNEAIPYAEKAIKSDGSAILIASAYTLLGSIYDQDHQTKTRLSAAAL
jgi:tetratricopeptide (TPR) repeat protein